MTDPSQPPESSIPRSADIEVQPPELTGKRVLLIFPDQPRYDAVPDIIALNVDLLGRMAWGLLGTAIADGAARALAEAGVSPCRYVEPIERIHEVVMGERIGLEELAAHHVTWPLGFPELQYDYDEVGQGVKDFPVDYMRRRAHCFMRLDRALALYRAGEHQRAIDVIREGEGRE